MQNNMMLGADLLQNPQRAATIEHEVFGNNLDEINGHIAFDEVAIMLCPKTNAKAGKGVNFVFHCLGSFWKMLIR